MNISGRIPALLSLLLFAAPVHALDDQGALYGKFRNPDLSDDGGKSLSGVRHDMISQAAFTLGLRAGSAQRAADLIADMNKRQVEYDRAFRFSVILTKSGVFVPPVIDEMKDALSNNADTLRITKAVYRIIKRGRLQAQPPTWREYMFVGLNAKEPDKPARAVLPKSDDEKKLWDSQFDLGWKAGIAEAEGIYRKNMARLVRDYIGMRRYTDLRDSGVMTSEMVIETHANVREASASDLSVDETTYRLTSQPSFITDSAKWKRAPTSGTEVGAKP